MNLERDKFLTELLGETWMEINNNGFYHWSNNFSTWDGFGKLVEWVKSEESPYELYMCLKEIENQNGLLYFANVNIQILADTIYEFMKGYKNEG